MISQRTAITTAVRVPGTPPSSGAASWYAGLLIFYFLPFINSVVASIVMICVGLMYRRQNLQPTRTVGARAASWGLTYLLATLLFLSSVSTSIFYSPWTARKRQTPSSRSESPSPSGS